jgi:hypothetical protein
MGFAGLAVDVGYWEYKERQQQNATDAAALGAAQQLLYTTCPNSSVATTAAQSDGANGGFAAGGRVSVVVSNPPTSGPFAADNCAVSVQISTANVASFFTRLFGQASGVTETTQAVATISANANGCIYLLNQSQQSIFNGDTVIAPSCAVLINDTATFNGDANFDAASIGYAGSAPIENGTAFTQATPAPMLTVADPCPEIVSCTYLTNNPPSSSSCVSQVYNGMATVTLYPGCYSSLIVNGCPNVTLSPGLYIFNGPTIFNGSNFTGTGVTLYVPANGTPPNFNGTQFSFSPPTSGNYTGVVYYQVPSNTLSPNFNGSSVGLSGLIYAPSANGVVFNGTSGGYLVVVVDSATFNGSAAYDLASPPPNGSLVHKAVLAQ